MPQKYNSPWPKADAQRRQAMTSGRNIWKQPEPPLKPNPRQYFILGMEVDYNTYREYNFQKTWTIDGDVLKGFTASLWTLEHYATDEHAKDYPIETANARKILDQIREEINTITGKDDKNMKTPRTAADFIDALNDIYTESRNAYAILQDKVDKAAAKMERAREELRDPSCKDKQMAQLRFDIAQGEYKIAEDARRGEYVAMVAGHEKKVSELRAKFAAHLDEHYAASPDKLDTATMQLLDSGICTPVELARLVDRHQGNPTMLRIVGEYARKIREDNRRNMSHDDQVICTKVANAGFSAKDGSRELAIFDSAVSAANYGLGKDYKHATRMDSYMGGWFEDLKQNMNNLPVIPEEIAPDNSKEE